MTQIAVSVALSAECVGLSGTAAIGHMYRVDENRRNTLTPLNIVLDGSTSGRHPLRARRAGLEAVEKVFTAWIWGSGFIAGRTPPGDRVTNRPVTLMEVLHLGHRTMVTYE